MADTSAYEATFTMLDTNKDGRISAEELQKAAAAFGNEITIESAEAGVRKFDSDDDGEVTLEEYASFMATL